MRKSKKNTQFVIGPPKSKKDPTPEDIERGKIRRRIEEIEEAKLIKSLEDPLRG